jgi:hypothetical protein
MDTTTAIVVAIVALLATILGATIGAITNYVIAVRRDRAERDRDDRNHAIEVKRAARLIDAELSRAVAAANMCVEQRSWWNDGYDARDLSTEAWQKYSGTIAADLSNEAWLAITIAIEAVDDLKVVRNVCLSSNAVKKPKPIEDSIADLLSPRLRDIKRGRDALIPFVSDSTLAQFSAENRVKSSAKKLLEK